MVHCATHFKHDEQSIVHCAMQRGSPTTLVDCVIPAEEVWWKHQVIKWIWLDRVQALFCSRRAHSPFIHQTLQPNSGKVRIWWTFYSSLEQASCAHRSVRATCFLSVKKRHLDPSRQINENANYVIIWLSKYLRLAIVQKCQTFGWSTRENRMTWH